MNRINLGRFYPVNPVYPVHVFLGWQLTDDNCGYIAQAAAYENRHGVRAPATSMVQMGAFLPDP